MHRIIRDILFVRLFLYIGCVVEQRLSGLTVFFRRFFQLSDDDFLHLFRIGNGRFQLCDILFQLVDLLRPFQNIFPVQMTQLDLRHILRLDLINAKADHQIRHNIHFFFCLSDNADCLVDVQQNLVQTQQQMQLFLFLFQIKHQSAAHAFQTKGRPFFQNFTHAHYLRRTAYQNIKIAGIIILERCHAEQFLHNFFRVRASFQIYGDLQAVNISFIPDIGNLTQLSLLDAVYDLILDCLDRGAVRNLRDFQAVVRLVIRPLGTNGHAATSGFVNLLQFRFVIIQKSAAGKIRSF